MSEIIEAIVGGLVNFLTGWLTQRSAAKARAKAVTNQANAEAHSAVIGDQADAAVEKARESNDAQINQVRADAAGPDGLRKQSADVQSDIDAADSELP